MATVDKDFKVKNGLIVANGGTFGGTVTVSAPTLSTHAATKAYVDSATGTVTVVVDDDAPASPSNGNLWFDTITERVYVYYSSAWIAMATLEDAEVLQEHIHNTAIGGTGQIATTFVDAGYYYEAGDLINAGYYNAADGSWENEYSGGTATEVYN